MKVTQILGRTMLVLLPIALVCAQEKREEEKKPEQKQQQAKPSQQAKPAQQEQRAQQQEAKPAPQSKPAQQQQHAQQQEAKPAPHVQPQQAQHSQQQAKPAQQQGKPAQQQAGNRAQPAGGHGRIPDDRFRASFGRAHTFRVNRANFEGSSRRFQYGGFWFNAIDPWPVAWLYTDDVYVDYMNGGYFLCDPVHPGVYLSISIG